MWGRVAAEAARFRNTVIWSLDGWRATWATEKSLRQWTLLHGLSCLAALALDISQVERALIIGLGFLVLAAELLNTAIEEMVDDLSPEIRPRAKKAKDCGSAGVAMTALAVGAVWVVVLSGLIW